MDQINFSCFWALVEGEDQSDKKLYGQHRWSWSQREAEQRGTKKVINIHLHFLFTKNSSLLGVDFVLLYSISRYALIRFMKLWHCLSLHQGIFLRRRILRWLIGAEECWLVSFLFKIYHGIDHDNDGMYMILN